MPDYNKLLQNKIDQLESRNSSLLKNIDHINDEIKRSKEEFNENSYLIQTYRLGIRKDNELLLFEEWIEKELEKAINEQTKKSIV